jgi:hypothetical protein
MSRTPSLAPSPRGETGAPIYTRRELEAKIRLLNERLWYLYDKYLDIMGAITDTKWFVERLELASDFVSKLDDIANAIAEIVYDIVVDMVAKELKVDRDVEKYNIEFPESALTKVVGVVLVDGELAVVWAGLDMIGYTIVDE